METKEMKIVPPEGYEIDRENSTFECIKFKQKSLTYENVARELFNKGIRYYINELGKIGLTSSAISDSIYDSNNATSKNQLKKLLAINKLMNTQKYLCPDYKPKKNESAWSIYIDNINTLNVAKVRYANYIDVFFPSEELAHKAINILGENTIRLALSTDW